MIIDANVTLRAFFPDEVQANAQALVRDHVSGRIELAAPTLLLHEVANACLQAVRRGRVTFEAAKGILTAVESLQITIEPVNWQMMFEMGRRFGRSAYDAAYLALAEARGEGLVTGDRRLYNAVHDDLDWVHWIGDS